MAITGKLTARQQWRKKSGVLRISANGMNTFDNKQKAKKLSQMPDLLAIAKKELTVSPNFSAGIEVFENIYDHL